MLSPRSVFLLFILVAVGICETFGLRLFLVDKAGNLKDVASNSNASLVHGEAFLDLACVADGPVEWIYEGGGVRQHTLFTQMLHYVYTHLIYGKEIY